MNPEPANVGTTTRWTNAIQYAIPFTAAVPIALFAHEGGLEPSHAAAVAATLPGAHAAIDLVVRGPDLTFRQIWALTAFHCGTILILAITVAEILEIRTLE